MRNGPIGQYLVQKGLITEEQLQEVLAKQKEQKGRLFGDVIIDMKLVTDVQFCQVLAERLNVSYIDLDNTELMPDIVKKIPEATARKYNVIAVSKIGKRMTVATNDPINFYIFEDLRVITGCSITPVLATKSSINRAIGKMYSEGQVNSVVDEATKQKEEELNLEELKDISEERIENAPIVKLATAIVENAQRQDATDIHIEPFKDKTVIRIRVNGDLIELMTLSAALHTSLVTRFKILSGMNIAEKRIPQDGRMSQVVDGTTLDLRVSNLPMVYGEKVVLRILATGDMSLRKITDLGMTDYNYKRFEACLKVPQGVVLVTGPTGSGKSTTLYAALGEISKPNNNVITVEDPVEKKIDGVNQCQINEKAGMTFGAALRSILRQDPDIIMVGEIRDGETADIAIRAAITGHFVLSTLHTNDAASTIVRLVDMGVAPYMVASSLVGIIAQRLVKLLCNECKETITLSDPADLRLVSRDKPVQICQAHKGGCKKCRGTGYSGRTAIHEIIVTSNDIKELISKGATAEEIGAKATENGTLLLRDNVTQMVLAGRTTMDELVKATYTV